MLNARIAPLTRLAALLLLSGLIPTGLAVAAQSDFGSTIPPERCVVDPLTRDDLLDIVADSHATPVAHESELVLESTPLPDDQRDAIVALIAQSVACSNANDPMRALALFTDGYLRERFGGEENDDLGHLLVAITREPAPAKDEDMLALISIDDFQLMDDGRVSITVVTGNVVDTYTDRLVVVDVDGTWLIDEAGPVTAGESATPST